MQRANVKSQNSLTPKNKVGIALAMAAALADLHGFEDGVILNGDNHIDQFLATSEGRVKLGDFNLATILEWNDRKGDYCKREREPWAYRVSGSHVVVGTEVNE
jgi:hypothetical protein